MKRTLILLLTILCLVLLLSGCGYSETQLAQYYSKGYADGYSIGYTQGWEAAIKSLQAKGVAIPAP